MIRCSSVCSSASDRPSRPVGSIAACRASIVSVSVSISQSTASPGSPVQLSSATSVVGSPSSATIFSTKRRASASSACPYDQSRSPSAWYSKPNRLPEASVYPSADRYCSASAALRRSCACWMSRVSSGDMAWSLPGRRSSTQALQRDVAVLALRLFDALRLQRAQGADQLRAGLVRDDHVVDVAALGGGVRVGEAGLVVLHELRAPLLGRGATGDVAPVDD